MPIIPSYVSVAFTHVDPPQITGHPQYQICPMVKPCPQQDKPCAQQDQTCSEQEKMCNEQDKAKDKTCPQQDKRCSVCCVTAVFQCTAEGTLPLTFTWWRNTTNYPSWNRWIFALWQETEVIEKVESNSTCFIQMVNKHTSQLSFSNTSVPVFEEYFCKVSNAYGQSNSEPAMLFVYKGKRLMSTWF